jgi:RimJ/RimL family protein N-acetyltransferase
MGRMPPEPSSLPLPLLDCDAAILRPWRPTDLDSLVANANDSSVSRNLRDRFPYPYTGNDGRAWLARAIDEADRSWAIDIEGEAVGGVGLHLGNDVHRHSAELGYWLGQRFWGRGIMTRVLRAFVPTAMDAFQLYRLHAMVYENNPASARVLEKAGFACEGVQRSAVMKRGALLDIFVYARVRQSLSTASHRE